MSAIFVTHTLHTSQAAAQVANIFFQLSHAAKKQKKKKVIV